jgi:hypothetical protein
MLWFMSWVNLARNSVVERGAGDRFLRVVDLYRDVAALEHHWQGVMVVEKYVCHTHRVDGARKLELPMHHVAGVEVLQSGVFQHLQIQLLAVERRDACRARYIEGVGA